MHTDKSVFTIIIKHALCGLPFTHSSFIVDSMKLLLTITGVQLSTRTVFLEVLALTVIKRGLDTNKYKLITHSLWYPFI